MGFTENQVKVSENCTHEEDSEDEEDKYSPDTPSLMVKISEKLDIVSRTEQAVAVDD